jgi:flagellar biosynthesis chaperone FliJ
MVQERGERREERRERIN